MSWTSSQRSDTARAPFLRPVDFSAPSSLAPDQEGRLRRLAVEFAETFSARAGALLSASISFDLLWIREESWKRLHPLPADDSVALVLDSSAGGTVEVALCPSLVSLLAERALGVDPDPSRPQRPTTDVDRELIAPFLERLSSTFAELWEEATGAHLTPVECLPHRDLALSNDPSAKVMMMAFNVRLGASHAAVYLFVPQETVRPVAHVLSRPPSHAEALDDGGAAAGQLRRRISGANVIVDVHLGRGQLSARAIGRLAPGDRVGFPTPADSPVTVLVEGVPLLLGSIRSDGAHRVVVVGSAAAGGA